jgi:hypothetical protein
MPKNTLPTAKPLPDWELVLSSAARLQRYGIGHSR